MKLYELSEAYRLLQRMEDEDGLDFSKAIEEIQEEAEAKLISIAKLLRELEAEESAYKAEIDRMQKRAKSLSKKSEALKAYAFQHMTGTGITEVEGDTIKISIQKSQPVCEVTDQSAVPSNLKKVTLEIPGNEVPEELLHFSKGETVSKKAVIDLWKKGFAVGGTEVRDGSYVRIR